MGKGLNTAGKIVAWVLAILLLAGVAGVIVYFVAKEEGADYFVEYNGEKYLGNAEGGKLDITSGNEYRFEVRSLTGENVNFDVKVTSNPANNFEYTVDGKLCVWNGSDEKANDYTDIFNVQKDETGFTMNVPKQFGIPITARNRQAKVKTTRTSSIRCILPYLNGYSIHTASCNG